MTQEFESVDDLIQTLRSNLAGKLAFSIGIDGIDGSGKSSTSERIAQDLNVALVSMDAFLNKNRGTYVENLRLAEIADRIQAARFIIEGCCLLEVCERLGVSLTRLVYIKRLGKDGEWSDQEECDVQEPVEQLIARLDAELKDFDRFEASLSGEEQTEQEVALASFRKEVIRYHARYRPFDKANYVLHVHPDGALPAY